LKNNLRIKDKIQETRTKGLLSLLALIFVFCFLFFGASFTSCHFKYGFKDVSPIPDSIRSVKVNYIENKARYINPQLSPRLSDKLRQKIVSQTKLSQTNSDNADWEISGYITDYSFNTSAISGQQVANNRLTVSVHITLNNHKTDDVKDYDVSRNFEFKGNQSFQQAEASLLDEMIRTLTDEIFNKLFSSW
jgi:basic membrane lipoprotein Med (substrate-binding protein (PBP1-ABC) superfamily)